MIGTPEERSFALSPAQLGLWHAQQLAGHVPITISQYVAVEGEFDPDLLAAVSPRAALESGSGVLRLVAGDTVPRQFVDPDADCSTTQVDFRDRADPHRAAIDWMRARSGEPLDPMTDRLVSSAVLRIADDNFLWYCRAHHLAMDGLGAMNSMHRVAELYTAARHGVEPPRFAPLDLAAIARDEHAYRTSPRFVSDGDYWRGQVADLPAAATLSRRAHGVLAADALVASGALDGDAAAAFDAAVARLNASAAPLIVAAFAAFLARMTGTGDVVLGLPVSARTTVAMRRSAGMVSNIVPLRLRVTPETTVAEILQNAQTVLVGALRHQRYRHEDIRRDAGAGPDDRGFFGPVVNIMMFHREIQLGDVTGSFNVLSTGPVDDLAVNLYQSVAGTRTHIDFEANPNRYDAAELSGHHERFLRFLRRFVSAPPTERVAALDLLDATERAALVPVRGPAGGSQRTLGRILTDAAAAHPDAVAVSYGGLRLTYRELDERAGRVARVLAERGVGPEVVVAVGVERSVESVVAAWAVAKAGGAFVPVDPDYPEHRVAHMLADSNAAIGVTTPARRADLPDSVDWLTLEDVPDTGAPLPQNTAVPLHGLAYLIYTSGSTGTPKGVAVTHAGLENFAVDQRRYRAGVGSRILHVSSPSFDGSIFEYLLAFASGATLVIAPPGVYGGAALAGLIRREAITHAFLTPAPLASIADEAGLDCLTDLVVGGEAVQRELVDRWAAGRRFVHAYGPTETTIMTALSEPVLPGDPVTMGSPITGTDAVVVDAAVRPVPAGSAGEVYIGGVGLARGYHGRPGLTAARFVANPWGAPGDRMYRTGDVVRWTAVDRPALEFVGRSDSQVKVRGLRIEPGEIDAVLASHGSVAFVVTLVRHTAAGAAVLVSYVLPAPGFSFDAQALTEHATSTLAPHMVPARIVELDALPLTPVGKLDRRALPEVEFAAVVPYRAPSTPIEEGLAAIMAEVVEHGRVGVDDSFFDLGGNSLTATQLVARAGAVLGVELSVRDVFEAPTVADLAGRATANLMSRRPELVPLARPAEVPLSPAQQRLWFVNRLDPRSGASNIPLAIRLVGELNPALLRKALHDVVIRHESLRTVYPDSDAGPVQVVLDSVELLLPTVAATEADLDDVLCELGTRGFDLVRELPLRATVVRLGRDEHVLVIVLHHISADGWSLGPLARDVMAAYAARLAGQRMDIQGGPEWPALPVQYADYTLWQRALLDADDDPASIAGSQLQYWLETLADLPDELALPTDRPRPAVASYRGGTVPVTIDAGRRAALQALARRHDATPFMVLHAVLAVLLTRFGAGRDLPIGTPVAGRGERGLDDLVGMFVNTLVLRTAIDPGATFTAVLEQCRTVAAGAFANADIPFERLVERINPHRSTARHPLFQVMLAYQNLGPVHIDLHGTRAEVAAIDTGTAKFDLQLTLVEHESRIDGEFNYATDLFDEATARQFAAAYAAIIDRVLIDPDLVVDDLTVLDDSEHDLLVRGVNATRTAVPAGTIIDLFEAQVAATPDATAIVTDTEALTYREFDERCNRLARALVARGVGPETRVALGMARSIDLLAGMYAVAKAGGAYVPLDLENPPDRIEYVLATAGCAVVLTTSRDGRVAHPHVLEIDTLDLSGHDGSPVSAAERLLPLRPSNTAYVIFTSGSTGRPKGVAVSHQAAVNLLRWMQTDLPITAADRVVWKAPATFDVSVWECFAVLGVGGSLLILPPEGHLDTAYLVDALARHRVTIAEFVPSMLDFVLAEPDLDLPGTLHMIYVGGEAISPSTAQRVVARGLRLGNFYGPTEAAVTTTYFEITAATPASTVPIGDPVWNTSAYVLDERLHPVPVGVAGELYLAGGQLARGYVSRPDLTADRFVADPFDAGARMYRTGDLVRWRRLPGRDTPTLEFLGRTDFQVKVRGLRIELAEIEAALLSLDDVDRAVMQIRDDAAGNPRLVAYVTAAAGQDIDTALVTAGLADRLPRYMLPADYVVLDAMPVTPTGKLDLRALPVPDIVAAQYRPPRTSIETTIAEILSEVLGRAGVGLDDDFFAIGGNSLIATRVAARLGSALGLAVPLRLVFEAPTVAELAHRIETDLDPARLRPVLRRMDRPVRIPLSPAQQRIWFLNRYEPLSAAYNLPFAVRFTGVLDVAALQGALTDVIERHEALRTMYPETPDGPSQVVLSAAESTPALTVIDCAPTDLAARLDELAGVGFDVTAAVPLRFALFRVAADQHVLVVVLHHISSDGWSVAPLARDMMRAFARRTGTDAGDSAPLPVHYADYALWQLELLGSDADPNSLATAQLEYWLDTLTGMPDRIELPVDRPRPPEPTYRGGTVEFDITAGQWSALQRLALQRQASMFMVAHAALAVLLRRLGTSDDVVVGTAVAGRGDAALDDLIGMFVNTLVLRTRVDPGTGFADLLAHVREVDLGALGHSDIPFERVVDAVDPPRDHGHHPLFQVALSVDDTPDAVFELPGLRTVIEPIDPRIAQFDLQLTLRTLPGGAGMTGVFTYATDLFDHATVGRFARRFVRILDAVVTDPDVCIGDVDLLSPSERAELVPVAGRGAAGIVTLPEVLARVAAQSPDSVAVRFDGRSLTYRELDERSNRLARWLIRLGARPETFVALGSARSVEFVVALWAVAKSGAGFLPVDPSYPRDRIEYMATASGALLGLAADETIDLPGPVAWWPIGTAENAARALPPTILTDADRSDSVDPQHPAYLIFTSGSTGTPKGVTVTHVGLANLVAEQRERFAIDADSVVLHAASPSFDASVFELLMAFHNGATLVVAPPGVIGGAELAVLLRAESVTHAVLTPAVLGSVDHRDLDDLRAVVVAGDVCPPELVSRWAIGRRMFNAYGPTEGTVWATSTDALDVGGPVSIGEPIRGVSVAVLDSRLHPVPVGVAGELYISGPGLARGYIGRAALTAERFVADPYGPPGERMYRTGDLTSWTSAGELRFIGRSDFQVKIRGLRIELGEIDAVLATHPDVEFAVTVGHDIGDQTVLVSYVDALPGTTVDVAALTTLLRGALPAYMVPAAVVALDEVPLTPAGKLDRSALPRPEPAAAALSFREPESTTEHVVAAVFAEVTGSTRVGLDDSFFELGGNSLTATQVVARVGDRLERAVPVRVLFDSPTVAEFARALSDAAHATAVPLTALPRVGRIPLSLAQQRIWFLCRFAPDAPVYNLPLALRLRGHLDSTALDAAVTDVFERHESLRTVYPDTGEGPHQVVLPAARAFTGLAPIAVAEVDLDPVVAEIAARTVDITTAVPVRAELLAIGPDDHVLVLVLHHICADGWSLGPLARDILQAYAARAAGRGPSWSPLQVQYADFSVWQRALLGADDDPQSLSHKQIEYWKAALRGAPEQLDLPVDRPRPPVQTYAGRVVSFTVDAEIHAALRELGGRHRASLFMVLHAAFALLLSRSTGSADVVIGAPVAGRGDHRLDDLVGMFVNTLVLRTEVDLAADFAALLQTVRDVDLGAYAHSDVPFERLVEALNPTRSTARHPLFQVALSLQNLPATALQLPRLAVEPFEPELPVAKFDLHLTFAAEPEANGTGPLQATIGYASDLFDESTVRALGDRLVDLLRAVVADPTVPVGDLELLTDHDRQRLLLQVNDTRRQLAPRTLTDLVDAAVRATPGAIALEDRATRLTYAEFEAAANSLARTLVGLGAGPEQTVVIALPRSIDLVVAIHATVRAGAAYVPIDLDHPGERNARVVEAAAPVVIVTSAADAGRVPPGPPVLAVDARDTCPDSADPVTDRDRIRPLRPENAAYVLFTSGSTGTPKGVAVSHAAVVNRLLWMQARYGLTGADAVLQKTPATFDVSVWELFWPLLSGSRMVIAGPEDHRDPAVLAELIVAHEVTVAHFVPSMLALFVAEPRTAACTGLAHIFASGEALGGHVAALTRRVLPAASVHNLYGPTEAAIDVTYHDYTATAAAVPIGRPVWNTAVYVLDTRLRPVPAGVVGELYLAGTQLARGYVGRPDLTADRFVASPFARGERLYRTGDLVRWNAQDELEYVGRSDFQVKLRGQRVELGEIEAALLQNPGIDQAVAVVRHRNSAREQVVAYVVGADAAISTARDSLRTLLPEYMVPAVIMCVDELPLTPNGKLDRTALPVPVRSAADFRAPRSELERAVVAAFETVLGIDDVSLSDSFFELGGNSLSAVRLIDELRTGAGLTMTLPTLFGDPTPEAIARRLTGSGSTGLDVLLPLRSGAGDAVFCIHPVAGLAWCYSGLLPYVPGRFAVYGLQSPVATASDTTFVGIADLADRYAAEIRAAQGAGPYRLLGWSLGGVLAHEVALRLQDGGAEVAFLGLLDSGFGPTLATGGDEPGPGDILAGLGVESHLGGDGIAALGLTPDIVERLVRRATESAAALTAHEPGVFDGDVHFFTATADDPTGTRLADLWRPHVRGVITNHLVDGDHWQMSSPTAYATIGPIIEQVLDAGPSSGATEPQLAKASSNLASL